MERAKASQLTIDTRKSPEAANTAILGDQRVVEQDDGPIFEQKVKVDDRFFMARIAESGMRNDDMMEYVIDMFRAKDE